ncbi:MAG: 50S ribosomal protein L21 [Candidatus Wallbacteria bacterium]|nr:50S ribosomal protein L21 [Candidatus Wallbacteria bacterium]
MYAIVECGNKQYKVEEGKWFDVDLQPYEAEEKIELDRVLMVNRDGKLEFGTPYLEKTKVVGKIVKNFKDRKVTSFKYRRRKDSHVKRGFRHSLSRIMVEKIIA